MAIAGKSSNLLFSDKTSNKLWTIGSSFKAELTVEMTCFLELKDNEGLDKIEPNLGSSLMAVLNFSTEEKALSMEESLTAALKRAVA